MQYNKKYEAIIIFLFCIINSPIIKTSNEFSGIYFTSEAQDTSAYKIFDMTYLNITNDDYSLYINGVQEINSSNIYPFQPNISYNVKVVFNKPLESADSMFQDCRSLKQVDLSLFNSDLIKTTESMFYGCEFLSSIDFTNFNTANCITMETMFYWCRALVSLNLSSFNTINVISMAHMFGRCSGLTSLDLSHFDTSNVQKMNFMFSSCSSLTNLNLLNFNTKNVVSMQSMGLMQEKVIPQQHSSQKDQMQFIISKIFRK